VCVWVVCVCVSVCVCMCVYGCVRVCIHICIYVYIYIYIHINVCMYPHHTYVYTFTYINIYKGYVPVAAAGVCSDAVATAGTISQKSSNH